MTPASGAVLYCSYFDITFIGKTAIELVCGLVSSVNMVGHLQARAVANTNLTGQEHASLMKRTIKKRRILAEIDFQGFFFS